jgi:hypothetical protein
VHALVGRSENVRYFEKLLDGKDPEIRAAAVQGLIQMQTRASGEVKILFQGMQQRRRFINDEGAGDET